MKEKISAVYQIKNMVTGEIYIGSSKNVKHRWVEHKSPSKWNRYSNSKLYQDMQEYGLDKFNFQILSQVEPEYLKHVEQEFIELLKPAYNQMNANGRNIEKVKACNKRYNQSEKGKETMRKCTNKYARQLCNYKGETLTLGTLNMRFRRAGIQHSMSEARKYLILPDN